MTHLVGAWSLRDEPIGAVLSDASRRAISRQLPDAAYREVCNKRLWLLAAPHALATEGQVTVALEGFSANRRASDYVAEIARGGGVRQVVPPPGHASMVIVDDPRASLTLLRSLSGGERLYYALMPDFVLFAGSVRYLLAYPGFHRSLNLARTSEVLLSGRTLFGRGTLLAGVDEVLPGHAMTWGPRGVRDQWHGPSLAAPLTGDPKALAREFHDELIEAVVASAGASRPVAVTLSGGIDSAGITALAAEAFGAENVVAFTYEFDDPTHSSETHYARAVCKKLGVTRHEIFRLGFGEFLAAIPETIWRAEDLCNWPKAFMLPVTRHIQACGFDRFLTGFGIGSHMAYFDDLAWCLEHAPQRALVLAHWRFAHRRSGRWLRHLDPLHPGLGSPGWRLLLPFTWLLRERGVVCGLEPFYPEEAYPFLSTVPRATPGEQWLAKLPLSAALRQMAFDRLFSCIDVTRWEKPMRELGMQRISPAHFAGPLPYAYLPLEPPAFVWGARRQLRPGKLLLRLAMRDVLPDAVLYRKKSWADAVISPCWFDAGVRWMGQAMQGIDPLPQMNGELPVAAEKWDRRAPQAAVTAFRVWRRLFVEQPPSSSPPTWSGLAG